jgi:hypothetical protein
MGGVSANEMPVAAQILPNLHRFRKRTPSELWGSLDGHVDGPRTDPQGRFELSRLQGAKEAETWTVIQVPPSRRHPQRRGHRPRRLSAIVRVSSQTSPAERTQPVPRGISPRFDLCRRIDV